MELSRGLSGSISSLIVVIVVSWLSYTLAVVYIQYRRLQHIKGPFIAAVSPLWLFYHIVRGELYLAVAAGIKKYGSPLRVAPNMIATDDPVLHRYMLAPKSPFTKGYWFDGVKFDDRLDNLLSMKDEKQHAELRNKVIPGYTGKEVPSLESDIDGRIVEFITLIGEQASKGVSFDMAEIAAYFTLDVLTQIAFGEKLGFLEKNQDIFEYHRLTAEVFPILDIGSHHPTMLKFFNSPIMKGLKPKPTDKIGFGAMIGHTRRVVAQRFGPNKIEKQDMMGSLVRHGLTQMECESESLLQLLAGSDSTSTALRTTLLYTLTNPRAYSKLVGEITNALKDGTVTRPVIKHSEAQSLPYLQAVVKEGLRMLMPLQGLSGRVPPKGGATVNGLFIPEGTQVGIAIYAMQLREDIYGHDADTFNPERWIDNDPETIAKMGKTHELIFSYGRASCLGKNIALTELGKAVFEIFAAYDLTIVNAFRPMTVKSHAAIVQKEFFVRAYTRQT